MVNRRMTGNSRIVSIDPSASEPSAPELAEAAPADPESEAFGWAGEEAEPSPRRWPVLLAAALALVAIAGWSVLFALVHGTEMLRGGSPAEWAGWIRDWAIPVLLVAVCWLVAMRHSRREARRFGETARLLGDESARLEARLTTVNRELSLAREFLASQTRDLEAMGRVATERLGASAERLTELVHDNGARLETIGTVSSAALDNMERLRGQLPVIASSAKDVTNNIGNAGRTAQAQLEEMITGFNRLNQFGQASERQVHALRGVVEETLAGFARQAEQLETIADQRFAALNQRGEEFRSQLDGHEVEALASIRNRASALGSELETSRAALDEQEAQSLTSLRARLNTLRDESASLTRALREGEEAALESWALAIGRLEADLQQAVGALAVIDEQAMESARLRLSALNDEATEVREYMAERDKLHAEELERRRVELEASQTDFVERLAARMAELDQTLAARRAEQEEHDRKLAGHVDTMASQLADFSARMGAAAEQGGEAEARIAASLETLAARLSASREALNGTDRAIVTLTDGSVRLLELIQASVQHSSHDLPQAIGLGEAKLERLEQHADALRASVVAAEAAGAALNDHVTRGGEALNASLTDLDALHARISARGEAQAAAVADLRASLDAVRAETLEQAEAAQGALRTAIEELNAASHSAVAGIGDASAEAIKALAARLGEDSAAAIDQAMRQRAAEVAGQLEQAAAHAAGVSREAAIQLRDQLAKVGELTSHLERRVAHARERAEEQVDNDFARRVALITEALNSNAIDIARAIDADVTDTAWAAYLKGDRGIFTRRAVRLLDAPEAKAVVQLYEGDPTFRDHVSRYIHDFEAMLRQLLSTRDGHALGVTLLSSDMGKLYVALAQSIERLRG